MIRTTARTSRRWRRCTNGCPIEAGERYLEHVASPNHGDLGNYDWWRMAECAACAARYGRSAALAREAS